MNPAGASTESLTSTPRVREHPQPKGDIRLFDATVPGLICIGTGRRPIIYICNQDWAPQQVTVISDRPGYCLSSGHGSRYKYWPFFVNLRLSPFYRFVYDRKYQFRGRAIGMTHRYRIEPSVHLLIDKFEGKMAWHDVWEGIQRSTKDPLFQPGMNVVADLTAADMELGYEEMGRLTSAILEVPTMKYGRIAAVAKGSYQFGLARMFGTLADNLDIFAEYRVFSDFSEVQTWLGLPEDVELRL